MSKKARQNLKRDLVLDERESLLKHIEAIDSVLEGDIDANDADILREQIMTQTSFVEAITWLQPFIQHSLLNLQSKLDNLVNALEIEFPRPVTPQDFLKQDQQLSELQLFDQIKSFAIVKLYLDSSLMLYALGKNGAAIIELHGVLERQAIEKLSRVILLPDKIDIGRKILERLTLKDLALILQDCEIIDKDDIRYVEKLSKLRNGLAHRNPTVVSNAIFSGQSLIESEIDPAISEIDYIPFALKAIHLLIKIMNWDDSVTMLNK